MREQREEQWTWDVEFQVNIGLRQGSASSPLLLIMLME